MTSPGDCMPSYNVTNSTTPTAEKVELEAFLYITVVVVFYAASITFLLIRYASNFHEEKDTKYHYSEFVKRDRFKELIYQNKVALERTKTKLENIQCNSSDGSADLKRCRDQSENPRTQAKYTAPINCPVITITTCSEDSLNTYADSRLRDVCIDIDTDVDTMALAGSSLRIIESPEPSYHGPDMNLLMVPMSDDDMALSYDSGVDYLGGRGFDDFAECNDFQEDSTTPFRQANTIMKGNSAIEFEHVNGILSDENQ